MLPETLLDRVAGIIPRYSMLNPGDRVGVAVSGGADSVVLLHILHRLTARLGISLAVLHVNHRLRGAESDADEEFVRELARELGLEVFVNVSALEPGNVEQEARRIRRQWFRDCIATHGLRPVALGHTRSDQAETVLYRLLRGSGLAGLSGMRPVTDDGLVRPLLTSSREEVRQWAVAENICWREDSSNASPRFARNRLRNEAIPLLSEFNSNLERVLAQVAELARDEEEYWAQQVEPIYREIAKRNELGSILQVEGLIALPRAVQRRVIRRAVCEIKGDLRSIDSAHIAAVLRICESQHGHDRVIIPGVDALRSFEQLLLTRPGGLNAVPRDYRIELQADVENVLPGSSGKIFVNWADFEVENCVNFEKDQRDPTTEVAYLDGIALKAPGERLGLFARNWEPGDQLYRAGHAQAEKIKSLFQQYRVALWDRRQWPVVLAGNEIVWARGFGASARWAASGESRCALRLTYRRGRD